MFVESYSKARKKFYDHFMSQMLTIAGFLDSNFAKAFNTFTHDDANYKFALELSMEPEFFSTPSKYLENTLIVSLINTVLSSEKRRELFKAWASLCEVDTETGKQCHVMSCNWLTVVACDWSVLQIVFSRVSGFLNFKFCFSDFNDVGIDVDIKVTNTSCLFHEFK